MGKSWSFIREYFWPFQYFCAVLHPGGALRNGVHGVGHGGRRFVPVRWAEAPQRRVCFYTLWAVSQR